MLLPETQPRRGEKVMSDDDRLKRFEENLKTLNALVATHNKGLKLEVALDLQNEDTSATKQANNRLAQKIDKLRGKLDDEWAKDAQDVRKEITSANGQIEKAIKAIVKGIKVAENIVKAVGYIDRAVEVASRLLTAIA